MLEDIRKNIERLIALYEAGEAENKRLRALVAEREAALATCKEQISGLEEQIDTLTLSRAFTVGGNDADAKDRLDRMIKEIDRCISLLEKS